MDAVPQRKLGEIPELCDVNLHPMLLALANHVETNIGKTGKYTDPAKIEGYIFRSDMISLVRRHFNLQRLPVIQEHNALINTVIDILIGVRILEECGSNNGNKGYRTHSSNQLRELAES